MIILLFIIWFRSEPIFYSLWSEHNAVPLWWGRHLAAVRPNATRAGSPPRSSSLRAAGRWRRRRRVATVAPRPVAHSDCSRGDSNSPTTLSRPQQPAATRTERAAQRGERAAGSTTRWLHCTLRTILTTLYYYTTIRLTDGWRTG